MELLRLLADLFADDTNMAILLVVSTGIATTAVMRFTPEKFDKRRFGFPVSVITGMALSVLVWGPGLVTNWLRGLVIGAVASGGYDGCKSMKAIIEQLKAGGVTGGQ